MSFSPFVFLFFTDDVERVRFIFSPQKISYCNCSAAQHLEEDAESEQMHEVNVADGLLCLLYFRRHRAA